jgi:hypothetical protein
MIQAAQNHGMGEAGWMKRDWRAKNVGVMQGGGASQAVLLEASAKTLASATCTMINTLLATQGCR